MRRHALCLPTSDLLQAESTPTPHCAAPVAVRSRAPRSHASLAARHAGDGVGDAWAYARLIRARRCRLGRAAALPSPGVLCTARRPVRGREVSSGAKAPMSAPSLCVAATPSSSKPNPLTVSATPAQSSPHYCTLRVRSWTRPLALSPAGASRPQPAVSLNCALLFRHCPHVVSGAPPPNTHESPRPPPQERRPRAERL